MNLPFTREQFMNVFKTYNTAVFPMQVIIFLIGCSMLFLVFSKVAARNKIIGCMLGGIWIWTGVIYHIIFFTGINKAAYIFGTAFVLQGIIFAIIAYRDKLRFSFKNGAINKISLIFAIFGLILYPIIGYVTEKSLITLITMGLPCPTTIFTFGLLGFEINGIKKRHMAIALAWSFIGFIAAVLLGIYQDVVLPLASLYTFIAYHHSHKQSQNQTSF